MKHPPDVDVSGVFNVEDDVGVAGQLHGGYGYMWEYPVARAWADARVQRIYAGTNEVMKVIISRALLG